MKTTKIITRKYHDGIMDAHSDNEWVMNEAPMYTLYRVEGEETDWHMMPTTYSIICDYGKGTTTLHTFENIKTAFRVFRMMVGLTLVV